MKDVIIGAFLLAFAGFSWVFTFLYGLWVLSGLLGIVFLIVGFLRLLDELN